MSEEPLFQEDSSPPLEGKTFIRAYDLHGGFSDKLSIFPNRAHFDQLLSELAVAPGVGRVVRRSAINAAQNITHLVDPDMTVDQFYNVVNIYAAHSMLSIRQIDAIQCTCPAGQACTEVGLPAVQPDYSHRYTSPKHRLEQKHGPIDAIAGTEGSRLAQIVNMIEAIDPDGMVDFDIRLNRKSATEYGCVEVIEQQVRDAPYGADHLPKQELKTLCYQVNVSRPKAAPPFIVMVNTMADKKLDMSKVKQALKEAGLGTKFDLRPAEIEESFGIAKGEVHPLSLFPQSEAGSAGQGTNRVVHLYDSGMRRKGYVTTNGGHPDWTTEFRRDTFVARMEAHFNQSEQLPLVMVADINQAAEGNEIEEQPSTWEHERISISDSDRTDAGRIEKKAALLVTETTTLFAEQIQAALERPKLQSDTETSLHVYRQPTLDFETVKFPQCWRSIFEQLSVAVARLVREQINLLFLDCNIAPLEELFGDRMPKEVRKHVIEVLRSQLNGELESTSDQDLIHTISRRVSLISKPVVVTNYLHRQALRGDVKDVFVVGGSQVSDPSISKYHADFMSIDHLINIHTLDSEQIRRAKLAMYHAEQKDQSTENIKHLYEIVKHMLPSIEVAEKPAILLTSTSLCQTYHDNGDEIIPEHAVGILSKLSGLTIEVIQDHRRRMHAVPVINTTKVYAEGAAAVLANHAKQYGYHYV